MPYACRENVSRADHARRAKAVKPLMSERLDCFCFTSKIRKNYSMAIMRQKTPAENMTALLFVHIRRSNCVLQKKIVILRAFCDGTQIKRFDNCKLGYAFGNTVPSDGYIDSGSQEGYVCITQKRGAGSLCD